MENLGRTLIKIKWQTGAESVLLPDDIDSRQVNQWRRFIPDFKVTNPADDDPRRAFVRS